jgi:hypothetical protein
MESAMFRHFLKMNRSDTIMLVHRALFLQ